MYCVFNLCNGRAQNLRRVLEVGLQMGLCLQLRQRSIERTQGVGLVFFEQGHRSQRGVQQCLAMGQAAVAGVEFFPFVVLGRELVEFANLPGQAFALALQ